jgi:hypothetical protein
MGEIIVVFWVLSVVIAIGGYFLLKNNYLRKYPEHKKYSVGVLLGLPIFQLWLTANICLPAVFALPAKDDIWGQLTSDIDVMNMTHDQWEGMYIIRDLMVIAFLVLGAFSVYAIYGVFKREGFTAKKLKTTTLILTCLYVLPIISIIIFGFTRGNYFPIDFLLILAAFIFLQKKYNSVVEDVFSFVQPSTVSSTRGAVDSAPPTPKAQEHKVEATKRCPYCGEEILAVAQKCKHCGEWIKEEPKEMIRCSVCGEKVEKGLDKCPMCNEHLFASHHPLDMEETTKPCLICGEPILEIAKKCKHCGEWQNIPEPPKVMIRCSICGEEADASLDICPHCNEPLIEKSE